MWNQTMRWELVNGGIKGTEWGERMRLIMGMMVAVLFGCSNDPVYKRDVEAMTKRCEKFGGWVSVNGGTWINGMCADGTYISNAHKIESKTNGD